MNASLVASIDEIAHATDFSGVVSVSRGDHDLYETARGFADRAHRIPNAPDTRFGIASGTKGFTALAVMSLVAEGTLDLDASARDFLGDDLDTIDPAVTVGHLVAHTSGIGDYLDESVYGDVEDFELPVPVQRLAVTSDYLAVLRGYPMKFAPGERFEYCNGGYVILALVIEAVTGITFHEVVEQRVWHPGGMSATAFLRSDELPGDAAIGYLPAGDGWRTNHFHLPVRGSGDGGAYSTVRDFDRFWHALFAGRIVAPEIVEDMVRPHHDVPSESLRYGLGFWLRPDRDTVMLEGEDAGVSFRSAFDRPSGLCYTVMSNTTSGAWPLVKLLDSRLPDLAGDAE